MADHYSDYLKKSVSVSDLVFDKEVSSAVEPGDGVIIARCGRRIKVFEDPDRKGVMDVSRIRSGIR